MAVNPLIRRKVARETTKRNIKPKLIHDFSSAEMTYEQINPYCEAIHLGKKIPTHSVKKSWPLDRFETPEMGEFGTITFHKSGIVNVRYNGFKPSNLTLLERARLGEGIHIESVRSLKPGAAKTLIERVEQEARNRGLKYVYLFTANPKMLALLRAMGYKTFGRSATEPEVLNYFPHFNSRDTFVINFIQ